MDQVEWRQSRLVLVPLRVCTLWILNRLQKEKGTTGGQLSSLSSPTPARESCWVHPSGRAALFRTPLATCSAWPHFQPRGLFQEDQKMMGLLSLLWDTGGSVKNHDQRQVRVTELHNTYPVHLPGMSSVWWPHRCREASWKHKITSPNNKRTKSFMTAKTSEHSVQDSQGCWAYKPSSFCRAQDIHPSLTGFV